MNIKKVGIIGYGIIGKAILKMFLHKVELYIYDINFSTDDKISLNMIGIEYGNKEAINDCEIAFVCVPSPHNKYDGLDMTIIEEIISTFNPGLFVVSSTMQPGTADRLVRNYNKRIVVNPEYFGETVNHPLTNLSQQSFLILGGDPEDISVVIKLYQKVYNANVKIRKVLRLEAEVIKMSENRAAAYKIAQCQELYDVCNAAGVDYDIIREAVYSDDPRFNLWWTFVYEDARGINSKCLPKDIYGWCNWASCAGVHPELTRALIDYNKKLLNKHGIEEL